MADCNIEVVEHGRQFWEPGGKECFYAVAEGRRPDVRDALLVMGKGPTRQGAVNAAWQKFQRVHRSLQSTVAVDKDQG